jgi:hypothetical protein
MGLPPAVLVLGLWIGAVRPFASAGDRFETLSGSLVALGILIAVSQLGAALGAWSLAGFAVGTLAVHAPRIASSQCHCGVPTAVAEVGGPEVIVLGSLALLTVAIPLAVAALDPFAGRTGRARPNGGAAAVASGLARAAIAGSLVGAWVLAFPVLQRPVFTWLHTSAPRSAVVPLQHDGMALVVVAIVASGLRVALERLLPGNPTVSAPVSALVTRPGLPSLLRIPLVAAAWTFLLVGLADDAVDGILLFAGLLAALAVREMVGRLEAVVAVLQRVPVVVRIAAAAVIAFGIAVGLLNVIGVGDAWRPVVIALDVGLIVMAVLVPVAARPARPPSPTPAAPQAGRTGGSP